MDNTQKGVVLLLIATCLFLSIMGLQSTAKVLVLSDTEYSALSDKGQLPVNAVCETQNTITYLTSIILMSAVVGGIVLMVYTQFFQRH